MGWPKRRIIVAGGVIGGAAGRIIMVRHIRANRKELLRAMNRRGYDLCTSCGYWLTGLGDEIGRCPECGSEREEQTVITDRRSPAP